MTEPLGIPVNLYYGCNSICNPNTAGPLYGSLCRLGKCCCKCHLTDVQIDHFKIIASSVFDEGGDGDIVVFPTATDYELLASKFHAWLVFTYPGMQWVSKNEYSAKRYVIYCGQESFVFADPNTSKNYFRWSDTFRPPNGYPYTQRMDLAL